MGMTKVTTNVDGYIKWNEVEEGAIIRGFYKETKPSTNYPDSPNHYIETVDGKLYGLNSAANLNRAMNQVKPGWYVEITYKGSIVLEQGKMKGSDCHQFEVAYDDERIHPLFGGSSAAREEVEYKKTEDEQDATPPLMKPQSAQQNSVPAAASPQPAAQQPAQQTEAPKKRSIF